MAPNHSSAVNRCRRQIDTIVLGNGDDGSLPLICLLTTGGNTNHRCWRCAAGQSVGAHQPATAILISGLTGVVGSSVFVLSSAPSFATSARPPVAALAPVL